jgi:hypothetical protein
MLGFLTHPTSGVFGDAEKEAALSEIHLVNSLFQIFILTNVRRDLQFKARIAVVRQPKHTVES